MNNRPKTIERKTCIDAPADASGSERSVRSTLDTALDEALENTFPASDPVALGLHD